MARKTPGDDLGQKRRRSKPKNKEPEETPPPLTAEEFEQAFKQYCSEKDVTCRLRRKLHGRDVAVHALYNYVASFGGPKGASSQRAWSRVADMLSPGASHKAGVANELSKLYAATLGGFAPVALGMFPDAADRPHGAYQDLTPASLPDEAQEPETNGEDTRTAPRAPPRVSAAQLKALKRFGAVQSGGSVKRPRLEGPSGPLSRLPTKNTSSFILLNGSASGPRSRDGDDSDGGGGGAGGGRLLGRRPMSSGLPPLKVSPAGGLLVPPGSPDHHHPPSAHRANHHGHHHHHGHGGGQHGMSLLGSSPRGVKLSQHRAPGGAFGTLLEDFEQEPQDGMLGGIDLAKAVQRTHGIGKVRGGVTYVETEPDDDWRPPAAVCISTEHEWRLGGSAFKEQKYGPGALKGMLAWLRHLSTAVGTAEIMTEALSDSEEAQEYQQAQTAIVLQTYLGRFRREAFHGLEASGYVDTRIDPANVRRSGRTRQPTYELEFKPAPVTAAAEASEGSEWDSEDEEPGVRHGEEFQVEAIPRCRRLLDKMSASERHWLSRLVARRGGVRLPPLPPEPHDFEHMSLEERLETVTQSTAALRKALGPHCAAIGLGTLGTAAVQPAWTDAEEALLEEGMRAWGRDFRQIQKQLLPAKSASDLVIFYYNVWKTRGTPRARAWWHAVEEARKQEEEEEAMWEAARAEADRKRVDSHHAATQNRQLRDMLGWQRLLARNPRDPVIKPRSKERIARVVDVLHEQAMDVLTAEAGPRPEFIVIPAP